MLHGKPAIFDLELRPNRSLQKQQFRWVIIGVGALFFLMGLRFLMVGAWLILPFMLADIALLSWAMRASYKSGIAVEYVRLDMDSLYLVRHRPGKGVIRTRLEPYWSRVELERLPDTTNKLWIHSRHQRYAIGQFLSSSEREDVAKVIETGLHRWRNGT